MRKNTNGMWDCPNPLHPLQAALIQAHCRPLVPSIRPNSECHGHGFTWEQYWLATCGKSRKAWALSPGSWNPCPVAWTTTGNECVWPRTKELSSYSKCWCTGRWSLATEGKRAIGENYSCHQISSVCEVWTASSSLKWSGCPIPEWTSDHWEYQAELRR